eukprot:GILK01007001.1.p1 GENE.GILK01007001.1~~GILK01007001.1.p1  ORF type:complete len:332 (+),score=16.48 GILK01007001.1:77-997(+)
MTVAVLSAVTLTLLCYQTYHLYCKTRRKYTKRLIILYLAVFHLSLCCVRFVFVMKGYLIFFQEYIKYVEYTIVCYFFATAACRLTHRLLLLKRVIRPVVLVNLIYLSALMIEMFSFPEHHSFNCRDFLWILMRGSGAFLTLLFLLMGCWITSTMNSMRISTELRARKNRHLWILIVVNFLSAAFAFGCDIFYFFINDSAKCDHVLQLPPVPNAVLYVLGRTLTLLVPMWAIAYVFWTWPESSRWLLDEERLAATSRAIEYRQYKLIEDEKAQMESLTMTDEETAEQDLHSNGDVRPLRASELFGIS